MPSTSNVVQIIVAGTVAETGGSTKNVFNVFNYMQNPVVPNPPTAVTVGNQFLASVWAQIAPLLSVAWVGSFMQARYLDITTNAFLAGNVPASGAKILPRLSSNVAVVTPFRTGLRSKNYRGNKHFGPIDSASATNDELTAAAVAAWQAILPTLSGIITVTGQTFSPAIVSRSLSQLAKDPVNIQATPITSALLNKTLGTMRRRKEKTVR